jgi:2-oxoisovalerate dehydrogenase E1 component
MITKPLPIQTPLIEIVAEDRDWDAQSPTSLRWLLQQIIVIRRFEEKLLELKTADCIHGPVHTSIGQEGVAAGMGCALRPADKITGTHRAHHQYLAKVLSAARPSAKYNPVTEGLTPEMHAEIRVLLAEIMGLAEGCSGGRGGSMHLFHKAAGMAGSNAIVAGGVPHATGIAWAEQRQGRDTMTISYFGDGAMYQGVLDESSNLAALWKAPIVYFIENNQYSVGTTLDQSCSAKNLHEKAVAYGMPGLRVDGMNPLAVQLALEYIWQHRTAGWLPCYVDAQTYRYLHHAGNVAGSAYGYRNKDEETQWRGRDPLEQTVRQLRRRKLIDDAALQRLEDNARRAIDEAVAHCVRTEADGKQFVRAELWPTTESLTVGIRDESIAGLGQFVEQEDVPCPREIKFSDAIAEATGRWLERDPLAFVLGEEVANMGGGAYGATKGLPKLYPDRIRNTPISESGFSGFAAGAAMNGMRPIVEIMFSSFVLVAADQLLNQIGQLAHIYGGKIDVPVVVRTRIAIGVGYGAQHSLDPVALFQLFPGWRIFAPTTAFDYIGMFNVAMRAKSPTLIVEHHEFYPLKFNIPDGPPDHLVRPGKAKVIRPGKDVTVLAYSSGVLRAREAAAQLATEGINAEVIDLRSLDCDGLDFDTIGASLRKTGMLVTVEQAPGTNAIGGKIANNCVQRFFDEFDGPPVTVTGPNIPLPVSKMGELACLPNTAQVVDAIRRAARRTA